MQKVYEECRMILFFGQWMLNTDQLKDQYEKVINIIGARLDLGKIERIYFRLLNKIGIDEDLSKIKKNLPTKTTLAVFTDKTYNFNYRVANAPPFIMLEPGEIKRLSENEKWNVLFNNLPDWFPIIEFEIIEGELQADQFNLHVSLKEKYFFLELHIRSSHYPRVVPIIHELWKIESVSWGSIFPYAHSSASIVPIIPLRMLGVEEYLKTPSLFVEIVLEACKNTRLFNPLFQVLPFIERKFKTKSKFSDFLASASNIIDENKTKGEMDEKQVERLLTGCLESWRTANRNDPCVGIEKWGGQGIIIRNGPDVSSPRPFLPEVYAAFLAEVIRINGGDGTLLYDEKMMKYGGTKEYRGYVMDTEEADSLLEMESATGKKFEIVPDVDNEGNSVSNPNYFDKIPTHAIAFSGRHVIYLGVSGNVEFGENFRSLSHLKALQITDNSAIESLPEVIGYLKELQAIRCSSCTNLRLIPDSIGRLKKLRIAYFGDMVKTIPNSIEGCQSLEVLVVSGKLKEIPEEICKLGRLKVLDLSRNELTHLPVSIGSLASLEELFLDNNMLETIPESIITLKRLHEIKLSGNPLNAVADDVKVWLMLKNR